MPSCDSTDPVELDVEGRLVEGLLLNGAEAFRSASPMLDRRWRRVEDDFFVCASIEGDGCFVNSESLPTVGKAELRLACTVFGGDVIVGVRYVLSCIVVGRSVLRELATFDLRGKTSYVGYRRGNADSLLTETEIGRR